MILTFFNYKNLCNSRKIINFVLLKLKSRNYDERTTQRKMSATF